MNEIDFLIERLQETLDANKDAEVIAFMGKRRDWLLMIAALRISQSPKDWTTDAPASKWFDRLS